MIWVTGPAAARGARTRSGTCSDTEPSQNLIGCTLNGTWAAKLPLKVQFKQEVSWIPAYNNPYAYSASESDSLTMPFFKSLAFSVGSDDSYLNDPPAAVPPTKRNSFEFTTGLTYTLRSKY